MENERNTSLLTTREKLLLAGKEEFYQKGYRQASLRKICSACGVTTGAFYFLFPSKDALFCAIVDPVIEQLIQLTEALAKREMEDLSTGRENDRKIMEFALQYRKELMTLMEKAEGSSREDTKDQMLERLSHYFTETFAKFLGRPPKREVIKLLVSLRFQGILHILEGAYEMNEALFLSDMLACYADGGFQSLIKNLKDVL